MSALKHGLFLGLAALSTAAFTQDLLNKVIYGLDNRVEVFEASAPMQQVAHSTAAMIRMSRLTANGGEGEATVSYTTLQTTLKDDGVCEDDRYANQVNPASCSGFLVGPDLVVTAGHCIRNNFSCSDNAWVFGFTLNPTSRTAGVEIPAGQVYRCKEIINQKLNNIEGSDHALIRLDRVVEGVMPLKVRTEGKIADNTNIVVMGHPMGLPTKIADGAWVRTNEHPHFFVANLDTFGGNSGSAVFNTQDLTVEGILVRGETDYTYNSEKGCMEVFQCDDTECRGEDVTRITDIIELTQREGVLNAAEAGNLDVLAGYLNANGWVNIYDNQGVGLLARAAQGEQLEVIKALLDKEIDVKAQDLAGESVLHKLAGAKSADVTAEILTALVAAEVKLDAVDKLGNSALHAAVRANNAVAVKALLEAGVDPKLVNAQGKSALGLTKWYNWKQRKIRQLLLQALRNKA